MSNWPPTPKHVRRTNSRLLLISAVFSSLASLAYLFHFLSHRNVKRYRSLIFGGLALNSFLSLGNVMTLWRERRASNQVARLFAPRATALSEAMHLRPLTQPQTLVRPAPLAEESLPLPARSTPQVEPVEALAVQPASWRFMGIALFLAYLAQSGFDAQTSEHVFAGAIFYAVAMLAWYLVYPPASPARFNKPFAVGTAIPRHPSFFIVNTLRSYFWLAPGLLCWIEAIAIYSLQGENALMLGLWAGGIGLTLLMALFLHSGQSPVPLCKSPRFSRSNIALLGLILALGAWLRFDHLTVTPHQGNANFTRIGVQVRQLIAGEQFKLVGENSEGTSRLRLGLYAGFIKLFGNNLLGLYLAEAVAGTLSLLGLYLLVWRVSDRHWLAALAAAIAATNIAHIHFSRTGDAMYPLLFSLFTLWLLIDGLKGRRALSFLLAGSLAALAVLSHSTGYMILPVMIVYVIYVFFCRPPWLAGNRSGLALLGVGFLIALGPYLVFFAYNRAAIASQAWDRYIFKPENFERARAEFGVLTASPVLPEQANSFLIPYVRIWNKISIVSDVLLEQAKRTLFAVNFFKDKTQSFGYSQPMLSSFLSPLFFLGVGRAMKFWRRPEVFLSGVGLGLTMFFGGVLTLDTPAWPRLLMVVPFAAILIGLVIGDIVATSVAMLSPYISARLLKGLFLLAATILLVSLKQTEWNNYYQAGQNSPPDSTRLGRYLATLPPEVTVCNLSGAYTLQRIEIVFLAWPRQLVDLPPNASSEQFGPCAGPPFVWILYPDQPAQLDEVRARWSGGTLEAHFGQDGSLIFTSYWVK